MPVRLPDGIDGPFSFVAITDSPASLDRSVQSTIGFNNFGVGFEAPPELPLWDRVWARQRELSRGRRHTDWPDQPFARQVGEQRIAELSRGHSQCGRHAG